MKFVTALSVASTFAVPTQPKTHDLQFVRRNDIEVPFYYPDSTFETFRTNNSFIELSDKETIKLAKDTLMEKLGLINEEIIITKSHKGGDGVMHVYAARLINGVQVDNNNAAIHIKNGQVVAQSASFLKTTKWASGVPPAKALVGLKEAEDIASKKYGIARDSFPATTVYIQLPGNEVVYAHQFQLRDDAAQKWIQVSVDSNTGEIVQVIDYVQKASFKVLALPKVAPGDGFDVVTDPYDRTASPNGWNKIGDQTFSDTQGNNVDSTLNGGNRATGDFDTRFESNNEPTTYENQRAAVINNFYVSNMMHDITYQYGFTEMAGNFQQSNLGRGGKENDRVFIKNQAVGQNNANFATPPDGQSPVMNMFLWTFSTPKRDGSLENTVPLHEYGHGVSNRLTGGSARGNCLSSTESGGMGEGWSDFFAMIMTQKGNENRYSDYVLGTYVYNRPGGIRTKPYSTNMNTNPLTYNVIKTLNEPHAIGEVWMVALYELYWNMVDAYGYSSNLIDATQRRGNIMTMQLVMGGLKIQPCNPTLLAARDAILSADETFYDGANRCLIWKAFAKRGMGVDAVGNGKFVDGFKLPEGC